MVDLRAQIDEFKRLDLAVIAAQHGYAKDCKESWKAGTVMRRNGDKIGIQRNKEGQFYFWSLRDNKDRGTVLDFLKSRTGKDTRAVCDELRAYSGSPAATLPMATKELTAVVKDRAAVQEDLRWMEPAISNSYLEQERGIPSLVLQHWRFSGRIRSNRYGNAVFPHFDADGVCGYEIKGYKFTGFSPQGVKGLWLSKQSANDNKLVICETAIDDLAYAAMKDDGRTRYADTAGALNPNQPALIRAQIMRLPPGSTVAPANDNDAAGRKLNAVIEREFKAAGRADLTFCPDVPERKDWDDDLLARRKARWELVPV